MIKKAFLFPGQGVQYMGMGKVLCQNFKAAAEVFEEAGDSLGMDIGKLCFDSSLEDLTLTENAQPAILTVSTAMYRVYLNEIGVRPDIMAGHSLGEISALTCAGAIQFKDAVKLARMRGKFMQEAVKKGEGMMAAVQIRDIEKLRGICEELQGKNEQVSISNYNTGIQTVIAGTRSGVSKAMEILEKDGIKSTELNVSAPFHCPLMQPAADRFKEELGKYRYSDPDCIVLSNVTGQPYTGKEAVSDNLFRQIISPVQWTASMTYLKRSMVRYCLEIGPKHVLREMMKKNIADIPVFSLDEEEDIKAAKQYIEKAYIPFLARVMGIAVATKNNNFNDQEYADGVIAPYMKIQKLQTEIENEKRKATDEEMNLAIEMLKKIFATKKVSEEEQKERFRQLFNETGTEEKFAHLI
ncbi:MAG: ACP S-malonyltransferase [Lachnospiraceae bacterium]|nr:ACP S-malonyltransferase [Lachnospiraceae bacterium]